MSAQKHIRSARRVAGLTLAVGAMIGALSVPALGHLGHDHESDGSMVSALEVRDPGPDACVPMMVSFADRDASSDALAESGLDAAVLPSGLLAGGVSRFSCLADNLAGRVEMVILRIRHLDSEVSVVLPHPMTPSAEVEGYLSQIEPGSTLIVRGNTVVSVASPADERWVVEQFDGNATESVWARVIEFAVEADRSDG